MIGLNWGINVFPSITQINAVSASPDKPVGNQVEVTLERASPCPPAAGSAPHSVYGYM